MAEDVLRPLTSKRRARKFVTLDLESKDGDTQDPGFTRPFLAGLYDGVDYMAFRDSDRLGTWDEWWWREGGCIDRVMKYLLVPEYSGRYIYAHNGGGFDFFFLLPWLMNSKEASERELRFTIVPVSSTIQMLEVEEGKHKWTFLDSMKLIPMGLDKAGKAFGFEGKLKHDLALHEDDSRWISYLKQDCVLLYEVLERFHHLVEKELNGEVGITAASTAMKTYRRGFQKMSFARHKSSHEFIREGYFGGRCEVFQREGSGLSYYDLNSSYPASMLNPMPVGEASFVPSGRPGRYLLDGNHIGFVRCDVTVPDTIHIPPLPVRSVGEKCDAGKLIFPVGRLHGVWDWAELEYAISMGCRIEKFYESWWYEGYTVFREFIEAIYKFRDKSLPGYNEGMALTAKLIGNSSYGKFAQRPERRKMYRLGDPDMPETAEPANGKPDSPIWYATEESDAAYIIPQISAHITTLSRLALIRYMHQAEAAGVVCYCDTDSIVTTAFLPSSTKLGELKDEYPQASGRLHGKFYGPKVYLIDDGAQASVDLVKCKGLRTRKREVVEAIASGDVFVEDRLEKVGQLARAGFSRGPVVRKIPRRMLWGDSKRQNLPDGSTKPWKLSMF